MRQRRGQKTQSAPSVSTACPRRRRPPPTRCWISRRRRTRSGGFVGFVGMGSGWVGLGWMYGWVGGARQSSAVGRCSPAGCFVCLPLPHPRRRSHLPALTVTPPPLPQPFHLAARSLVKCHCCMRCPTYRRRPWGRSRGCLLPQRMSTWQHFLWRMAGAWTSTCSCLGNRRRTEGESAGGGGRGGGGGVLRCGRVSGWGTTEQMCLARLQQGRGLAICMPHPYQPPHTTICHCIPTCSWWQPRVGRGGRLIFDRCSPLERFWAEPGTPEQEEEAEAAAEGAPAGSKQEKGGGRAAGGKKDKEAAGSGDAAQPAAAVKQEPQDGAAAAGGGGEQQADGGLATPAPAGGALAATPAAWTWDRPLWEQPNPYAQWLNKSDLASAALTRLASTPAAIAANPPTTVLKMRSPATGLGLAAAGGTASSMPGGSPPPGTASAATPGPAGAAAAAGTPATTAASRPGAAGAAAAGNAGRPPLPPATGAGAAGHHKGTPGTAGSARRDARRPAKAGQKSNLGPGGGH